MKKAFAIIFTIIMIISLVACGSSSNKESTDTSIETSGGDLSNTPQPTDSEPATVSVTIEEAVLVDDQGIKITAKRLENESLFGPEIKLLIENNSGKDLTFQCRNASVNGYMVETMMSVDVVNGKKANDSLTFMESDFDICGIDAIADIEFSFHIFDMSDWETYLDTDPIQIKTSIADSFTYSYDDSGNLVHEDNGVKIVVKGIMPDDSLFGPGIVVYIENAGDRDITVQARDVSIDGFMVDAIFSSDVMQGKRTVDTITFMQSQLDENEITSIENVELSFHIIGLDNWQTIFDTELINLTF